jgi:flagellar biosynthesis/type III secretory pathway protein FliH
VLSKILDESMADAQPVTWRRSLPIQTAAAQPVHSAAPDEILQLRARLTEMNAAAEQKARQAYETGLRAGEGVARKALESETRTVIDRLTATIADVASAAPMPSCAPKRIPYGLPWKLPGGFCIAS